MWPVHEAKARLSELLRLAKAGKPQRIGLKDPCILVSAADYEAACNGSSIHMGQWLIDNMPRGYDDLELPSRRDTRPIPFQED